MIEIPVPDLPIPDPIEFKAAVLRSKGRIASGLLHTKAGLLRAGANILAQKANALDKFAQVMICFMLRGLCYPPSLFFPMAYAVKLQQIQLLLSFFSL